MGINTSKGCRYGYEDGDTLYEVNEGQRHMRSNNRVIVSIWTSGRYGGRGRNGHVVVEVTRNNEPGNLDNNTYISFWYRLKLDGDERWPESRLRPIFENGEHCAFINDYTGDRLLMQRKPEYIFCFYSLEETSSIVRALQTFRGNQSIVWEKHGHYLPQLTSGNLDYEEEAKHGDQSCVSLACLALDAGRINRLIDVTDAVVASSRGTTAVSAENSRDVYRNLNVIQPSANIADYVKLQLVSGYVISPNVLVERLKIAKTKEWKGSREIRLMGRMTCRTRISENGEIRNVSYSFQHPTAARVEIAPEAGYIVDEMSYEWLPGDD